MPRIAEKNVCSRRRSTAFGWAVLLVSLPILAVAQTNGETKVVSRVFNGYARVKSSDGSYLPESYVFVNGGTFDGQPVAGDSIYTMSFEDVARIVAGALKSQGYVSSKDPAVTQQMIMLWYGTTLRTTDKPAAYEIIESQNSRILGFQGEVSRANTLSFTTWAHDFYDEFRAGRYFVVLKAYDFQVAQKEKRLKLLWESRFSLQRQAVNFSEELPRMAQFAARTFGQDTNGLFNPDSLKGQVKLDELKIIGVQGPDPH